MNVLMNARSVLAAEAMKVILASSPVSVLNYSPVNEVAREKIAGIAELAFAVADAMIAAEKEQSEACPTCHGNKILYGIRCPHCLGEGSLKNIVVPSSMNAGTRLKEIRKDITLLDTEVLVLDGGPYLEMIRGNLKPGEEADILAGDVARSVVLATKRLTRARAKEVTCGLTHQTLVFRHVPEFDREAEWQLLKAEEAKRNSK